MTIAARRSFFTMSPMISATWLRRGGVCARNRCAACALLRIAVNGWLSSRASEPESAPSMPTRDKCATSLRCRAAACSIRRRSDTSTTDTRTSEAFGRLHRTEADLDLRNPRSPILAKSVKLASGAHASRRRQLRAPRRRFRARRVPGRDEILDCLPRAFREHKPNTERTCSFANVIEPRSPTSRIAVGTDCTTARAAPHSHGAASKAVRHERRPRRARYPSRRSQ